MILDSQGHLVWFHHISGRSVCNLEVKTYRGKPVLTWWQGKFAGGHGSSGSDVIMNSSYQTVAVLHAGNGYASDLHEFQVTPQGTALIDAYVPVRANLSRAGRPGQRDRPRLRDPGARHQTGRVLWEWHALGHVPISASYVALGRRTRTTTSTSTRSSSSRTAS